MHGGVVVDADGRRFADETVGYSEFAALLAARPGAPRLGGARRAHRRRLSQAFTDFRDVAESGALRWADDAEELAARLGVAARGAGRASSPTPRRWRAASRRPTASGAPRSRRR